MSFTSDVKHVEIIGSSPGAQSDEVQCPKVIRKGNSDFEPEIEFEVMRIVRISVGICVEAGHIGMSQKPVNMLKSCGSVRQKSRGNTDDLRKDAMVGFYANSYGMVDESRFDQILRYPRQKSDSESFELGEPIPRECSGQIFQVPG